MKKFRILIILSMMTALALPISSAAADNGVDDLRGRWDIQWGFDSEGNQAPLLLYVNELRVSTTASNTYLAAGCMRSPDTKALMPLSLRAIYDPVSKTYEVVVLSTIVPPENEPFVIRLNGTVIVYGEGVKDDTAQGTLVTEFAQGGWYGVHHDRRITKCPSIKDYGLGFQGDVFIHRDLGYATPRDWSLFEGHTIIVSSGMLVEAPDGSSFIVQEYTDIFSPDVDFIGRFRYLTNFEGTPIVGGTYKFTLLDVFGEPIPGAESTDIWRACNQSAPVNLNANYEEEQVSLVWDDVPAVPGQFVPGAVPQIGFYQIELFPFNWPGNGDYGANGIASASHIIPWNPFEPGSIGNPDGYDYGSGLGTLQDGKYLLILDAFSQPAPNTGGFGHECSTFDSSESLVISKLGNNATIQQMAVISGRVTSDNGVPLSGAEVGACPFEENNPTTCYGDRSDANGYYSIFLPAGTYRVNIGGMENWANEFYNDTPDWNLASPVSTLAGQNMSGVNFALTPAGTISGTVRDADGNPLAYIAVDTENGGHGTCTDENGHYTLFGVPYGSYHVVAGRDFCGPHHFAQQMSDVITVNANTPHLNNVDFALAPAGTISGTVYDSYGNPLANIAVDTEFGGFGTCTDENGRYTLSGVPYGTYRVVAGRDFCGPHPFAEATSDDVAIDAGEPDLNGVDFKLDLKP